MALGDNTVTFEEFQISCPEVLEKVVVGGQTVRVLRDGKPCAILRPFKDEDENKISSRERSPSVGMFYD
ncbi:MAG: hypothetical protein NVSMB66_7340 [Candidatus Doudnabacteria bacterium]